MLSWTCWTCWWLLTAITAVTLASASDVQSSYGPIITPALSEITLETGQNFTLICKGNRALSFKHQETYEDHMGSFVMKQNNLTLLTNETLDKKYKYSISLDLINVDRFAVGYYACFDDTINSTDFLTNIVEEPKNTEHVSYIYVYVNGSYLNAPMRTFVLAHSSSSKFLIECKPTAPDVNVKLTVDFADIDSDQYSFSPKLGFTLDTNVISDTLTSIFICAFMKDNIVDYKDVIVHKHITHPAPIPHVTSRSRYFLRGETFSVNCTVHYESTNAVELSWIEKPNSSSEVFNDSNENSVTDDNSVLYNNLTIINASENDAGEYTCMSKNMNNNETFTYKKVFQAEPQIIIKYLNKPQKIIAEETQSHSYAKKITVFAYPPITEIVLLKDDVPVSSKNEKYHLKETLASQSRSHDDETHDYMMSLRNLDTTDAGNYTVLARNGFVTQQITFDLKIIGPPRVYFGSLDSKRYLINQQVLVECEVTGYPLPDVEWMFSVDQQEEKLVDQEDTVEATYRKRSVVKLHLHQSGNLTCRATNTIKRGQKYADQSTRQILIYEMPDGFGIKDGDAIWLSEEQDAIMTCIASKYDFSKPTWFGPGGNITDRVKYSENSLSYVAELRLEGVTTYDSGEYTCAAFNYVHANEVSETIKITVDEIRPPEIRDPDKQTVEVVPFQPINFTCSSDAVPPPKIEWYKDGELVENTNNVNVDTTYFNHTTAFSMLKIFVMNETNTGEYECRSTSHGYVNSKFFSLVLKEPSTNKMIYLSVIGVIFTLLVILVIYLCWKIRKEKQFRKELAAAGLLYFKEGVTKSINPELGITEQAELLPYDEKFEFPAEKLILGKQLGAGAFGVVYKAEARGIINAEETTTVAVKMVKKTADNMYIKALASELKIMVHLGKHINIVNLLGACTKNVGKRELSVIVEYCRFGNIHRYLQQHRSVFVDTLNDSTEKFLGKVNKGYWSSSNNSGANSEYFGSSNHTQNTDQTFLNTANTNRSGRKNSEMGYMQPEWRSNYESDYSFEGRSPRPLFSRDLLCWAFQIARGMEYLASRKVLHGDLAARNILLADDNIVKICDFGLAKSIYKNDEYQKKENSPLPVKWLAIECISDGIFSTQSDVWSFGIVLWELFTLAKTPYPHLSNDKVYPWLCDGNRLQKPDYADDKLYDIMRRCWEQKPTARPSFSQLQEIIGSFLEENVRNHYVDLNDPYMSMNMNKQNESEDYLDMVASPDYRNLVTPSAHHYVNDTQTFVLPTSSQLEHDAEGYLQMSPVRRLQPSPRVQYTKFDFDERKLASRASDGSESTPMLTLNHLPKSESESDHEDTQNAPSYLNVCPRIEEEADNDNVFELKQSNKLDSMARAVTNPAYTLQITDKKPKKV